MRVTNSATFRNFSSSVNDVHGRLNKSMNKISSGKAYETAADNPLAYYEGKKIDNQYLDTLSKLNLIPDVQNRLYQQELGVRDIQTRLSKAKGRVEYILTETSNVDRGLIQTTKDELLAFQQTMVNDLNAQYRDFYIYGGNDVSTPPFSLSADGMTLTYSHKFPGDNNATVMTMEMKEINGSYQYEFSDLDSIVRAMSEQGRMDVGYGTIYDRETLIDTYTGGLNAITGLSSDAVKAMTNPGDQIKTLLNESPIGLIAQAVKSIDTYMEDGDKTKFRETLAPVMDKMTASEHRLGTVYSDLGNKYNILGTTEERLGLDKINLTEQYKNKLGADPYDSIIEMYSYQQSYNAALKVSSYMFGTSLFDFMR